MRIFVGNIAWSTTEAHLVQLFEVYGTVGRAHLATDRETGRPRGFGFVEMPDSAQAREAITELHGMEVGGRPLTVNEAREREDRGGPRRR
jgi:cold-inducible RNA-binding protein